MSILLNENTRVMIQGITGKLARFHTSEMVDYGTKVVAGVVPGRGGEKVDAIPVFNTVKEAAGNRSHSKFNFCASTVCGR